MIGENFSHYRVHSKLGHGGMGEVYLAEDTNLRRKVALKILPVALQEDPVRRQRFLREAQLAASVDHPYVCKIYDVGEWNGTAFIAMEYIDGVTLIEHLRAGPLGVSESLRLSLEISEALTRAHQASIIHRDLKPSNVMLTRDGHVKVVDFGLAKNVDVLKMGDRTETLFTNPGFISGTLGYMSPEQCRGQVLDQRSDIFSLGIMLYEMLSAVHPFRRNVPLEMAVAIMHDDPPAMASAVQCPIAVQQLVQKMLSKEVEFRYQTSSELVEAIRAVSARPHDALPDVRPLGPSIAVLPFINYGGDKDNDYLTDGMTEEIIVRLSKISSLRVIALRSVLIFKNTDKTVREIGRELGVSTILEGSIRFWQDHVRVLVALVDVSNGSQLWAESYDRQVEDFFAVQRDVSTQIAAALRARYPAGISDTSPATLRIPQNLEAYHLYLKGRHSMGQTTPDGYRNAIQYFRRALDVDATYARSYAGLALCYATSGHMAFMPPKEAFTLAKAAASKAIEFDPNLSEAHVAMGMVYLWYEWKWDAVNEELSAAAALAPNDPNVHVCQSVYNIIRQQPQQAVREMKLATELDPLSTRVSAMYGWALCFAGKTNEAEVQLHRTLDMDPEYMVAKALLGETYILSGNYEEAIKIFEPLPWAKAYMGMAYALDGNTVMAEKILDEIKGPSPFGYQSPYDIGILSLAVNRMDEGFDMLEEAWDKRDPKLVFLRPEFEVTPGLRPLRELPRYQQLVDKLYLSHDGARVSV